MRKTTKKIWLVVLLLLMAEALLVIGPGGCAQHADPPSRGPNWPNPELKAL